MHCRRGLAADGPQREREDLRVRLADADLVGERRVPEAAEEPVALEEPAQRGAGRAHRVGDDRERVAPAHERLERADRFAGKEQFLGFG